MKSVEQIINDMAADPTNKARQWEVKVARELMRCFAKVKIERVREVLSNTGQVKIRNLKNDELDLIVAMANAFMARIDIAKLPRG